MPSESVRDAFFSKLQVLQISSYLVIGRKIVGRYALKSLPMGGLDAGFLPLGHAPTL